MKTDIQIMNELAQKTNVLRPITQQESNKLKSTLLEMYMAISSLCDRYDLVYMLGGGSCLGAVRHKGFIPWDDDLDMMMPRDSYDILIDHLNAGELGLEYEFSYPRKNKDCRNPFLKVFKKGTLDIELQNINTPFPKGVCIDIFPIDSAPSNKFVRNVKGFASDLIRRIATSVLYSEYPSQEYSAFMSLDEEAYKRYRQRLFIGKIFGIIKHKTWVLGFDRFVKSNSKTGYWTIATGRKGYRGETLPQSYFVPTVLSSFEGIQVPIPAEYDLYLKSLYRNYMEIPPENKRERHQVFILSLD